MIRLTTLPLALLAGACSDAPRARADQPVRIVRGASVAVAAQALTGAPSTPSLDHAGLVIELAEAPFDAVADAGAEASQTEARSRDLYRIEDSIVTEGGVVPEA